MAAGLQVMGQVALALQAAYTTIGPHGEPLHLLHRDIKPGNIRIDVDGSVKVLDFGIAKARGVMREAKTQATSVVGSFAYMAPERFRPREGGTPRGDVYSIGCVLYEIFSAGRMLYEGYELRELFRLAMMPPERMRVVEERIGALDVPSGVAELLLQTLVEEASLRPDLASLADRLNSLALAAPGMSLAEWASARRWLEPSTAASELSGSTLPYQSLGGQIRQRVTRRGAPTPPPLLSLGPPAGVAQASSLHSAKTVVLPAQTPIPAGGLSSILVAFITPQPVEVRTERPRPLWVGLVVGGMAVGVLLVSVSVGVLGAVRWTQDEAKLVPEFGEQRMLPQASVPTPPKPLEAASKPLEAADVSPAEPIPKVCADLFSLSERGESGALTPEERECLGGVMRNARQPLMERTLHGRVWVEDARWRCEHGAGCVDFEREQGAFFASVDLSDPEHLLFYAQHLYRTSGGSATRLKTAAKWAKRAVEKRKGWPSAVRDGKTALADEVWARSSQERWTLTQSAGDAATTKTAALAWATYCRQMGRDPEAALGLCRSLGEDRAGR